MAIATSSPLVQLQHVSKSFGPVQVLKDVSLDMHRGEVLCLAGENGAGKSTLIKIMTGAISRDSGEYLIDGQNIGSPTPAQARELGVGVVYQELSLLPEVSVEENLLMGHLPTFNGIVNRKELRARAVSMLERVGLNRVDPAAYISNLPLATRQMVEIAKVLGANARIVIFDEPTTALSDEDAQHLLRLIHYIKTEEGVAILYVTHRLEEIFEIGDRITVLRDGQFITAGSTSQFTHDTLISSMVGRQIEALYPQREHKQFGKTLLSVQGLRLQDSPYPISFDVHAGEIVGLGGLVGAGRTETVRAIFGADPIDAGKVYVDGTLLRPGSPAQAVNAGLGLLTEDRKVLGILADLSLRENVTIANLAAVSKLGVISRKKEVSLFQQLVPRLRLRYHSSEQTVSSLSGGNQQKILFSRWLATRVKVLLLDEPTKGVDVGAKADIYQIIGGLASQGLGIVVVSSYLPELLGICDRAVVLHDFGVTGEILIENATEEAVLHLASSAPTSTSA
ncbi:sugar ABC transporter ATP-binding protein [Dictyobacter formicarum]|uniref:Ribose import ATP-binding protein RbsA n=1 Tax=Dictyobacter formicarum TaxID=2778368 RepID=A0ABQ3VAI6_9CHLR|nr:sugar ABC transporter ATP-binding protein [Dictyobacter formicarum]GHO82813.1 ribose import ATP-binding protein RbsA [Dictyobacter formicarum]